MVKMFLYPCGKCKICKKEVYHTSPYVEKEVICSGCRSDNQMENKS